VCSVRNSISSLSTRPDTLIIEIKKKEHYSKYQPRLIHHISKSIFCLITRSESYSSAFFYLAIQSNCIPIVISDWFTFAFPWLIPYEQFVLRISESDFLKNPHTILDIIVDRYLSSKALIQSRVDTMRSQLAKYSFLLSYNKLLITSPEYLTFHSYLINSMKGILPLHTWKLIPTSGSGSGSGSGSSDRSPQPSSLDPDAYTILPLEIMLYEMKFYKILSSNSSSGDGGSTGGGRGDLPCYSPFLCSRDGNHTQVQPLVFSSKLLDTRSHLCRHNHRLIGMTKLVYFMQCVRELWPLRPGNLRNIDIPSIAGKVDNNITHKLNEWLQSSISALPSKNSKGGVVSATGGLTRNDYEFILSFHGITNRSSNGAHSYPYLGGKENILSFTNAIS